jgi:hypothetical protein
MNRSALTTRFLLFCLFFFPGAGAVILAILARPELYDYYHSRTALDQIHAQNRKLADLAEQYDARIALIEANPAILARFSNAAFNRTPDDPDTAFPRPDNARLRAETEKLLKTQTPPPADPLPPWLARITTPANRTALFLAGTGLLLITFIFFGTPRTKTPPYNNPKQKRGTEVTR